MVKEYMVKVSVGLCLGCLRPWVLTGRNYVHRQLDLRCIIECMG